MRRLALLLPLLVVPPAFAQAENRALLGVVAVMRLDKVVIGAVLPESPAARAGLEEGDTLLEIGGRKLAWPVDVDRALEGLRPGGKVPVLYARGDQRKTVEIPLVGRATLAKSPFANPRKRRGETGFKAPGWQIFAWSAGKKRAPPTPGNTKGKVVLFHAFQSW